LSLFLHLPGHGVAKISNFKSLIFFPLRRFRFRKWRVHLLVRQNTYPLQKLVFFVPVGNKIKGKLEFRKGGTTWTEKTQ